MARAKLPTTPAFTRLPLELLDKIIECFVETNFTHSYSDIDTLKDLRLSCRQFVHSQAVLSALFHTVKLVASPELARFVQSMDTASIDRHVKSVVFLPGQHDWSMDRLTYENGVMYEPLEKLARQECYKRAGMVWPDRMYWRNKQTWKLIVNEVLDGKSPISEEALQQGFVRYMAKANAT